MFAIHTVTLPKADNAGARLDAEHKAFQSAILDAFSGFTVRDVKGAWKDSSGRVYFDNSHAYDVAFNADANPELLETFQRLAHAAGVAMRQECVMVSFPGGRAELIWTNESAPSAAIAA